MRFKELSYAANLGKINNPDPFLLASQQVVQQKLVVRTLQYKDQLEIQKDTAKKITNLSTLLSLQIIQIIGQLRDILNTPENMSIAVNFTLLKKNTLESFTLGRLITTNISKRAVLDFSFEYIEYLTAQIEDNNNEIAIASIRSFIAHELYHLYCTQQYPTVMLRSAQATKNSDKDSNGYILDKAEIAATLFSIKHLRAYPEQDKKQLCTNHQLAKRLDTGLKKSIQNARNERLLELFSKRIRRRIFQKNFGKKLFSMLRDLITSFHPGVIQDRDK